MKNLGKSILCGIAALFALTVPAAAPSSISEFVPMTMNYQGYLANPSTGAAYTDGIYDIQCRLYTAASGGTAIWGAQYSVYVKDGYFNIMLGDSSSTSVDSTVSGSGSTTYGKDYLWKALLDTSYNSLYLGVTPLQNASHATLASPSEISPRQQLLTGPYAFRAQSAKYADASLGNFSVGGNLTVTGSVNFPSSYSLGSYLSVSSSTARFGGSSNSSSNPSTYLYGNYLYGYGYNGITFSSSNGNLTFSTPTSKSAQFSGGSFAVTNTATGAVISLKSRDITLDGSGYYGVTIKGYGAAKITTDSDVVVTGRTVNVQSDQSIYLRPTTSVYGQGSLKWKSTTGSVSDGLPPFLVTTREVAINAGSYYKDYSVGSTVTVGGTYYNANRYNWMIVGIESSNSNNGSYRGLSQFYAHMSGSVLYIRLSQDSTSSAAESYTVHLLGILKEFASSDR